MADIVDMNPGANPGNQIVATASPMHTIPTTREKASPLDAAAAS